jgi:hypothetical protein
MYTTNTRRLPMEQLQALEHKREQILQEMRKIRAMRKGSVSEQWVKVPRKQAAPVLRGPYGLYTYKEKGKTVGRRLSAQEAKRFGEEVKAYHHFQALCAQYAEVTEQLGEAELGLTEESPVKKGLKSRSRRTRK